MNTKTTTQYDLKMTALDAAQKCIDADNQRKDDLSVASLKLEAFNAAGHDRADYGDWDSYVNDAIANVIVWRKTPSRSALTANQPAN